MVTYRARVQGQDRPLKEGTAKGRRGKECKAKGCRGEESSVSQCSANSAPRKTKVRNSAVGTKSVANSAICQVTLKPMWQEAKQETSICEVEIEAEEWETGN